MNLTRRSTLRMALAMFFVIIAACIVTSTRAVATNCPYTVSISNGPGIPPCLTDFPMSVTAIWGGGTFTNTTVYATTGTYQEPTPAGAGGLSITGVTVNGVTVAATPAGILIPSSCPGRRLQIRVVPVGPNGCPWIYITLV